MYEDIIIIDECSNFKFPSKQNSGKSLHSYQQEIINHYKEMKREEMIINSKCGKTKKDEVKDKMLSREQFIGRQLRNIKKIKPAKQFIIGNKYILRPDYYDLNNNAGRICFFKRYTYWNYEMKKSISKIFPITIVDINNNSNENTMYSKKRIKFKYFNNEHISAYLHPEDFIDVTDLKITEEMMLGKMIHYCNNSQTDKKIIHKILENNFIENEPYKGGLTNDYFENLKQNIGQKYKMEFENGNFVLKERVNDNNVTNNYFNSNSLLGEMLHKTFEENLDNFKNDLKLMEDKKMDMTNFKTENLEAAQKQYEEEQKNEEIKFAKQQLADATDNINRIDRQIKTLEEQKVPYLETLEMFKFDKKDSSKEDKKEK